MARLPAASIWASLVLCTSLSVYAGDFYEWTDENGVTHFATSLDQVPEKYRAQVKSPEAQAAGSQAPASASGAASEGTPAAPEQPAASLGADAELRRFEIPYQPYEGSARRVIVSVTFNDAVTAPMLLDTGSPGMVISFELAEQLGVFSRDEGTLVVEAAGIGGVVPAILTIVDSVSVEGARDLFVPTTVTAGVSDAFQGLIGMDFLSNYTISIDSQKQALVFQEHPPDPEARGGHDEDWWRKTFEKFRDGRDHWEQRAKASDGRLGAKAQAFVDFQVRESERLLQRLDLYASDNAVPRHWR